MRLNLIRHGKAEERILVGIGDVFRATDVNEFLRQGSK